MTEKKKKVLGFGFLACGLVLVVVLLKITIGNDTKTYDKALDLISKGSYTEALEVFEDVPLCYEDREALIKYCKAHEEYDEGNFDRAREMLQGLTFKYLSDPLSRDIQAFMDKIEVEYKERLETTIPMTAKIERYDFSSAVDKYTTTTEKRTYTVPWLYVPKDKDYDKDNKKETTTDPFNAKDFYNPEDFYDYYYDDFMDYYEAEDYYYEHCG